MAGGRNDRAIADALQAMAQALGNLNQRPDIDWLERFQRNNPPSFRGGHNPDGAADWIFENEKIFQAMGCPLVQKVTLAAFMLSGEADIWWQGALQRMIAQGKDSVAEYVTKFEDLVKFCPMYDGVGNEEDKCVKFVSGLRPEIKQVFNYQGITQYHELVNKCRVYDEDNRARVTHYKRGGPMRNHNKFGSSSKGKPYTKSVGDSSSKVNNQGPVQQRSQASMASQTSKGGSVGSVPHNNCFKCGEPGHRAYECQASKCPLIIDGGDSMVDFICLPLSQLDVILGLDWLSSARDATGVTLA
ncbi:uncharacterized protein LOC109790198 [Cajanus cajan]|uniref:uncharacterized protein LOC109790198 n=1 Tax=Cajanus cajan TaxID=3821 RepID=UPI00098D8323|nr:uncharacterized protein LOC109790198 [Cajanus cajan]